jgi:hypothetical protein
MSGAILPFPNTPSWHGAQLKHRDNFTFNFTFTFTRPWSLSWARRMIISVALVVTQNPSEDLCDIS